MSEKIGAVFVASGIIFSLILAQPFSRAWNQWRQARLTWEQNSVKLNQQEELKQARISLAGRYDEVANLLVPGETGVAAAAAAMEAAAGENQAALTLTLEDFPKKADIGGNNQLALSIKAELEGSYQAVLNWTAAVERLPYLIYWSELKLGQSRQEGEIKAEFNGLLFLQE